MKIKWVRNGNAARAKKEKEGRQGIEEDKLNISSYMKCKMSSNSLF